MKRNMAETPPVDYWDELRELELQIRERERPLTPVVYPGTIAVNAWASGELNFDTTGYIAKHDEPLFRRHRVMVALTAFNLRDIASDAQDDTRLQRHHELAYELDLSPGHEGAIVFPAPGLKLTRYGIARRTSAEESAVNKRKKAIQKFGGNKTDFISAGKRDYRFIREQLTRGASGVFSRDTK
jgi:hypothetical protein